MTYDVIPYRTDEQTHTRVICNLPLKSSRLLYNTSVLQKDKDTNIPHRMIVRHDNSLGYHCQLREIFHVLTFRWQYNFDSW